MGPMRSFPVLIVFFPEPSGAEQRKEGWVYLPIVELRSGSGTLLKMRTEGRERSNKRKKRAKTGPVDLSYRYLFVSSVVPDRIVVLGVK